MLTTPAPGAEGDYERFLTFCRQTFGSLHEPLTYLLPGQELRFLDDGAWTYVSENSAVIAVETNLPATVVIEYGDTEHYGKRTPPQDRPHYLHIYRLTGLEPGRVVHYRIIATDERGQTLQSPPATLTPVKIPDAIYLIGNEPTPITLDQAGRTYVLQGDIVADGTALSVVAPNITIDLNGYTITYNQAPAVKEPELQRGFGFLATQGVQGIRCGYEARGSTRVLNGTIRQGSGAGGYGSIPLLMRGAEVAGVTIDYFGSQVSGIQGELRLAHHNVFIDRGSELTNRHQGVQCVGNTLQVRHNLFLRARHRAVTAVDGGLISRNEIYLDSCATNSFGVMLYKTRNAHVTDNRIFGTGYLAIGVGTVSEGVGDITVSGNFIHMQATAPDTRWAEYGEQSGAYGVRVTWGGENIEYVDNVIVARGRDGGIVRGVWFCPAPNIVNVAFRRNHIEATTQTPRTTTRWGAVVISGDDDPQSRPGLFEQNTIVSNFCNVRLGEAYGAGRNARFVANTFVKASDPAPDYATVIGGYGGFTNTGSVFLDSRFEGGADLSLVRWEGHGRNSFAVGRIEGGHDVIDHVFSSGQ